MALIDSTYFTGDILVPNQAATQLTQAITQYEKEILIKLLGYELYSLLQADLVNGVPVTQKYIDLVNGAEFTHEFRGEEYTMKWEGLKNSAKVSLIAYYVYHEFVRRDVTMLKSSGVMGQVPSGKDFVTANPSFKLCDTWEKMRELYGIIPPEYKHHYPYPITGTEIAHTFNMDASAYNFLYANSDDYPEWVFTPLWNHNVFGI